MRTSFIHSKSFLENGGRFDASFHLSEGVQSRACVMNSPYPITTVGAASSRIFHAGRWKRAYVNSKEHGIALVGSSDMLKADLSDIKLISRKYTPDMDDKILKKGWILISCSGTIGNTVFTNEQHAEKLASQDVIRNYPNNILRTGFVYSFLSTSYGYNLLTQGTFGAVIQHIEPQNVERIPIPVMPDEFQQKVDELIQGSARLRDEASAALLNAKTILSSQLNTPFHKVNFKTEKVNIQSILSSLQERIDPPALINDGVKTMKELTEKYPFKRIGEIKANVHRPGIFKRCYVQNGIPYIKGSEIFLTNPFRRCEQLSRTKTPFIDEMALTEGQILVTCAGSVGDIKMITKEYQDKKSIGSQDIIRLTSKDELYTKEYLFTYLQLPFVYDYIQSMKYGSVIERIEPFHVESIPVIEPTKDLSSRITEIIREYMDYTYRAFKAEEEAITLVEHEIEKWNK